jgi:hypothetical protein
MAEDQKPIRTKIIQKFDDGTKITRQIPEPKIEEVEAPKLYKETRIDYYGEPPIIDKYLLWGTGALCLLVAVAAAAYIMYKDDEAPAPALATSDQL